MARRKPMVEVTKDLDKVKSHINTPLLPENVPFEGEMFAKLPALKLEDWDLADCAEFPELALSEYLEKVHYEGAVIKVEPMRWALGYSNLGF